MQFLKPFLFPFSFLLITHFSVGQSWEISKVIPLKGNFVNASIDRYGNSIYANEKGEIYKYDANGVFLQDYVPQKISAVSLVESWFSVKTFLFYKEFQEYTLLDRQFSFAKNYKLHSESEFASAVSIASDGNIWVFDQDGFSIKKVHFSQNTILLTAPLDLSLQNNDMEISFLREYQNKLFLNDVYSGVLIFDNLGNYWKTIEVKDNQWFGFSENDLYYLSEDKELVFINIYSEKTYSITLPKQKEILAFLSTKEKIIAFTKKEMQIYTIANKK